MAVIKQKDMTWRQYLRQLAESPTKPSDIERTEFSGYLLRRDAENNGKTLTFDDDITDLIASFLIAESPDTTEDLLECIKSSIVDHYKDEINILIADEEKTIEEEKEKEDPRNEYDPNSHTIY